MSYNSRQGESDVSRPDVVVILTDQERSAPPYESDAITKWRKEALAGRRWFDDHGTSFLRHYTGSLACVPSRPTLFTGQYPGVHGVTQTNGFGKRFDDPAMRWLKPNEVPTLGHWFRAAGYDTYYQGKWHMSFANLLDRATGLSLATNDDDGTVIDSAVEQYREADVLAPFGFSGWIGPEPHGPQLANAGIRRDELTADRVVAWLRERHERRRAGDSQAQRRYLLVASFVNPHDIVFAPAWLRDGGHCPVEESPQDPPAVGPAPTADEDLGLKPGAQAAFRHAYMSCYGPPSVVESVYLDKAQQYRDLYYRLHAEVDTSIDRVRRAVTESGSEHAILVRTSDHGELLGAHGGQHQKWFNLYDEATRVPFVVVRFRSDIAGSPKSTSTRSRHGDGHTNLVPPARYIEAPTSHIDLVPTLLGAASINEQALARRLRASFGELHDLPGRNLMPILDGSAEADRLRPIYLMSSDNIVQGETSTNLWARRTGRKSTEPGTLIEVPTDVGSSFESLVMRVPADRVQEGMDHLWKVVRTFDDPSTWQESGERQPIFSAGEVIAWRNEPLPDEWELYDLDSDPIEAVNRVQSLNAESVFEFMVHELRAERERIAPQPFQAVLADRSETV